MSSSEPIGGYFELELPPAGPWLHDGALLVNSGRAALEYILRVTSPALVHVPRYTCDVLLEPFERTGTNYRFYAITPGLEIAEEVAPGKEELLLYTNYFGVMDGYCRHLAEKHGDRLILDCSQALFAAPPPGAHSFYSPRKLVGVPDGGCLYTPGRLAGELPRDVSADRYTHLVGRRDLGAEGAYHQFKENDAALAGRGMKRMSASTERLVASIDFDRVLEVRQENFATLHRALGGANRLEVDLGGVLGPMVYPFLSDDAGLRRALVAEKIFVATYWPNVFDWCGEADIEWQLASKLLPLPIDQRYGTAEMERIIGLVSSHLSL
jgi:hypothetical protein